MSHAAKRVPVSALAGFAAALLTMALQAAEADLTGHWQLSVETGAGTGNPTMQLEQNGHRVVGTYAGQLGEADVQGNVEGDAFELSFSVSGPTGSLDVTYSGTVENDRMSGDVDLGQLGGGSFTGERE